jgi:glycosidase
LAGLDALEPRRRPLSDADVRRREAESPLRAARASDAAGNTGSLLGDELGLPQVDIPAAAVRDVGGRDGARTPMPWNGRWTDPWLPPGGGTSVEAQRDDPSSILSFVRELLARRRSSPDLLEGAYESLPAPAGVWAYRRGESTVVALNLADEPAQFEGRELAPWDGLIL